MFANKKHEEAEKELKKGNLDKAILLYTEALVESPDDINILSDRGVAYLHKNDKLKCLGDLTLAIQKQPNYAYRYACRAFAKNHFKDIEGAINDYEKAVELDPEDAVANNNLGILYEQKGYQDKAKRKFEKADKLSQQENHLLEMVDEIEEKQSIDVREEFEQKLTQSKEKEFRTTINPNDSREEDKKMATEFKKIFTSKKQFSEFLRFIKNGFKIK